MSNSAPRGCSLHPRALLTSWYRTAVELVKQWNLPHGNNYTLSSSFTGLQCKANEKNCVKVLCHAEKNADPQTPLYLLFKKSYCCFAWECKTPRPFIHEFIRLLIHSSLIKSLLCAQIMYFKVPFINSASSSPLLELYDFPRSWCWHLSCCSISFITYMRTVQTCYIYHSVQWIHWVATCTG